MEKFLMKGFTRCMALLLCGALLLGLMPVSAFAEETDPTEQTQISSVTESTEETQETSAPTEDTQPAEEESVPNEETQSAEVEAAAVETSAVYGANYLTVNNVNYFVPGESVIVWGYSARELGSLTAEGTNQSFQNVGYLSDAARDSFANADFSGYTALAIEFMGRSNTTEEADAGLPEYYVEAIIDGSKTTTVAMADLHAATTLGFILYVPTASFNPASVSRGDLVYSNFWIQSKDLVVGSSGDAGLLYFTDNTAPAISTAIPAAVNATVRVFNYDSTAYANYSNGFNFWNGDYGYGADVESVDGWGVNNGVLQFPKALSSLSANGYPQLSDAEGNNVAALDYLFDSTYLKGTMTNGGGLFQKDADGYYYYDSLKNAAWYDAASNQFTLYNLIVRPWADSNDGANEAYGNFLPFNQVTSGNVTMDGTLFSTDGTTVESVSAVQGSLESAGLTGEAAALVLDDDGNNRVRARLKEYTTVSTARLEEKSDLWFGMSLDFAFSMPKNGKVAGNDMTFDFHGDDDVFVYLGVWNGTGYDYRLVLDIGGVHGARSGSINFATGAVSYHAGYPDSEGTLVQTDLKTIFGLDGDTFVDYEKLSLKFFYMERGGNISYCRMRFNIPTLPDNSLTVEKELTGEPTENSVSEYIADSYTYQFRVVQAENTEKPFFVAGTPYNILENGVVVGSGVLEEDGIFTLKANQSAQFESVLAYRTDDLVSQYVVQELLPGELTGQYDNVSYIIGGAGGEVVTESAESTSFTSYQTGSLAGDQHQQVIFRNAVDYEKLGTLRITKVLTDDVKESLKDQQFRMQVKLNGILLPVGTAYTVTDGTTTETKTVTRAGEVILTAGQTAQIDGILSGAEYIVAELDTVTGAFKPVYTGTVTGETEETVVCTQNSASGKMPLAGVVAITVTNGKRNGELQVDKQVEATDDPNVFDLTLEAYATGHVESVTNGPMDIVLVLDQSASMFAPVGGAVDLDNSQIYQVSNALSSSQLDTNLASHLGYYVAQSTNGRGPFTDASGNEYYLHDWFVVRYYNGAWYYVRIANFQKAVDMDLTVKVDGATPLTIGSTFARSELIGSFNYYKSQYGALYDSICTFVDGLRASGVNHRIAVTGFASGTYDARDHYNGTGIYVNGSYYLYDTDYAFINSDGQVYNYDTGEVLENPSYANVTQVYSSALVDVSTNYESIMNSVNAVTTNYLQTCPAAGLDMAKKIFDAAGTSDREQMVILFTDGHPTVTIEASLKNAGEGHADRAANWSESAGKNQAIAYAKILKDAGVEIFAIGSGAVFGEKFLNAVSSDYPDATGWPIVADGYWLENPAKPTDAAIDALLGDPIDEPKYTTFVTSSVELDNIFNSIQSIVTSTSVNLDGTAVLKDILSDYFDLYGDASVSIEVYTADYLGDDVFADPVKFDDAVVTVTSSAADGRADSVNISGFSYKDNFVAEGYTDEDGTEHPASGKKLIVKVKVTTRPGFWGGNNVPTNDEMTAIYSGNVPVIRFPVPEVNVPMSVGIAAQDKTIYYGGDVTAAELLQGVYAGGYGVTVGADGTLSPQADWMDDFATLSWSVASTQFTDSVNNRETGDYTFAVTLTPTHSGEVNQSGNPGNLVGDATGSRYASDSGHVYILVPAVTFEDSTIVEGFTPTASYYPANNYVTTQWVHMDENVSEDAPAVSGEAPELTLSYTAVGTEKGDSDYFASDTKINVTVSSEAVTDIATVTRFLWQNCRKSLHNSVLHGTIAEHMAETADQHEFWIHVPNSDGSDTGMVTDKNAAPTDDAAKFVLTLEAYAKGEMETINVTKPADIVLVLDHSGSMHTPVGAPQVLDNESIYSTTGHLTEDQLNTDLGTHFGYYVAQSVNTKSWFILQFDKSTNLWSGYLVHSTEAIVNTSAPGLSTDPDGSEGWTEHFMKLTWADGQIDDALVFYKSQYAMLYDAVHEFVLDLRASGIEHRVAIIGFSSSTDTILYAGGDEGIKSYNGLNSDSTSDERRNYLYQLALKDVQDQDEYSDLISCIDSINTNYSFTCPAAGIDMATDLFAANEIDMSQRDRIMVLFTDGIPNKKIGGGAGTTETQAEIFDEIVKKAYAAKSGLGAQIYSISTTTLGAGADRTFLSYASSDYPNATSYTTPGTAISPTKYTSEVSAASDLMKIFNTIKETATSTAVTLDETAVLREVLSDYFDLENGTIEDISVYTQPYNGADGTWGELDPFTAEEGMTLKLSSSDGSGRLDVIEVSGFDYHDEYVSAAARDRNGADYFGSRLVVKVAVKTREGFTGGEDVPTNDATTGIYSPDGLPVEKFPVPDVDVPVPDDVEIVPDTVVIDFGLSVTADVLANDPAVYSCEPVLTGIRGTDEDFGETGTGLFGTAELVDGKVRYTLSSMEMPGEDVFTYAVIYGEGDSALTATSTLTVIPATTIYYEEGFLAYKVYDYETDADVTGDPAYADNQWTTVESAVQAEQQQDRPGAAANDALKALDADNIYGYDAAYKEMATYSLGSARKVTVDSDAYAEATFTFWGTGFDVVSMTSNNTGTILVNVYDYNAFASNGYAAAPVDYQMVDTYYGYKYENGEWVVDDKAEGALYQVPVIKIEGLTYGRYTVVISASYQSFFDHNKADASYDFYLDAIRIYDPANDGASSDIIKDAYIADGEGWPSYQELRNLLIDANDFDAIAEGENTEGIIFIDNTLDENNKWTYTISDYTNFGPNNELYLAPGQSVAFSLDGGENVAGVHLAMKSVGGTVKAKVYDAADTTKISLVPEEIKTATDLYYDITGLNGKTVVIVNEGGAILSVTNIKTTYTQAPATLAVFSINREQAAMAVMSLNRLSEPEESIPEDEATQPTGATQPTESTEPETTEEPTEPEATEPAANDGLNEQTPPTEPPATDPAPQETEPVPEKTEPAATENTPDAATVIGIGLIALGAAVLLCLAAWLVLKRKEERG